MRLKTNLIGAGHLFVKRFSGDFWFRRRWLEKTQWLNKRQLEVLQLSLLKRLVCHCYESVPHYRRIMDSDGFGPESIRYLEDIKLFPVLTKDDVILHADELVSKKYRKWAMNTAHTGGTTGTPIDIKRDIRSIGNNHAFFRRQKDWGGLGLNDKCAYLTGRLVADTNDNDGSLYAYDPFMKELVLSTYHLSRETAGYFADVMNQYEVKALDGYPSAVYLLARTCLDMNKQMNLNACFTSSETLTASMRRTIQQAFKCKVYDYYGSAERTGIIHMCDCGSYHIVPEYGISELIPVDADNPQRCKLIATGFWNKAMPFVRYDTGDVVIKSDRKCPCGREFDVVESIEGRQGDVIKTPSGREFGAAILTHLLYGTEHIAESQIVQETPEHVTVEYVPSGEFSANDRDVFAGLISKYMPEEIKFDIKEVPAVRRTESGKVRPVVSQL